MLDLLIAVIAWNRPRLLDLTLASLAEQSGGLDAALWVVDNGSGPATLEVIDAHGPDYSLLLPRNIGINKALDALLPPQPISRFTLISDADMVYSLPLQLGMDFLDAFGAPVMSFQHSPEHPTLETVEFAGRRFHRKAVERGCSLLFRSEALWALRPFPDKVLDWDWWVFRDSPRALNVVYSLYGGAIHQGQGQSTWQGRTPEYPEFTVPEAADEVAREGRYAVTGVRVDPEGEVRQPPRGEAGPLDEPPGMHRTLWELVPWLVFKETTVDYSTARRWAQRPRSAPAPQARLGLAGLRVLASSGRQRLAVVGCLGLVGGVAGGLWEAGVPGWAGVLALAGCLILAAGAARASVRRLGQQGKGRPPYTVRKKVGVLQAGILPSLRAPQAPPANVPVHGSTPQAPAA